MTFDEAKSVIDEYSANSGTRVDWFSNDDRKAGKLHKTIEIPLGATSLGKLMPLGTVLYLNRDATPDQLVAVFFHELGHRLYIQSVPQVQWNDVDSEAKAFEFAVGNLCELGYVESLRFIVTEMRNAVGNPVNEQMFPDHVAAIKRVAKLPIYATACSLLEAR